MKRWYKLTGLLSLCFPFSACAWGFYAHELINQHALYHLPPQMMAFYKPQLKAYLYYATAPDRRRTSTPGEAPRHYLDMDYYAVTALPRQWDSAVARYGADMLLEHGTVPWTVLRVYNNLTYAFKQKNGPLILKYSGELGHYIADACVPLHTHSNYNGQKSGQEGIHALWESRIPELFAKEKYDFLFSKALYISNPSNYIWDVIESSHKATDSVLSLEKKLSQTFAPDQKYAFEQRTTTILVKTYSASYAQAYHDLLNGMVERRLRLAIETVASFLYSSWINAGQPELPKLQKVDVTTNVTTETDSILFLQQNWDKDRYQREHE